MKCLNLDHLSDRPLLKMVDWTPKTVLFRTPKQRPDAEAAKNSVVAGRRAALLAVGREAPEAAGRACWPERKHQEPATPSQTQYFGNK